MIARLYERAGGRRVYGYDSKTGRGGSASSPGQFKPEWDRACVEGDKAWTLLQRE